MSESFAEMLEEELCESEDQAGRDTNRHRRRREPRRGDRQRGIEIRGRHLGRSIFQRARRARGPSRRHRRGGARHRRGRLRRDAFVSREGQAHPYVDAPRGSVPEGRDREGHDQRPRARRLHRRRRVGPRIPAGIPRRRAPRSAIRPRSKVRRSSSRSSSSTRSATTWSCRGALSSRPSTARSASRC